MINIKGIITKIISQEPHVFKVKTVDLKEQKCQFTGFFPIRNNDIISAKGKLINDLLFIQDKPLVIVPASEQTLKDSFVKALRGTKFGPKTADKLYEELIERYQTVEQIVIKINQWAIGSYKDEKGNKDSADFIETISKPQLTKLLEWWYKNYNRRKLYLLGLNNKEITSSKMSEIELYENLSTNALSISSLSIEKAIQINNLFSRNTTKQDLLAAQIARHVNKNCNNGLMATPLSEILFLFKDAKEHISYISKNFNLVFEDTLVYTKNSYDIEKFLTVKIGILINKNEDLILRYGDMPKIVNPVQVDPDIELTDEQTEALDGALSSYISIITGGAGCGKTTLIKQLVKNLIYRKKKFLLTSFTGKAVLRIKETIKTEENYCFTLSRLIHKKKNYQPVPKFNVLIIDEASMVSSELIYNFMKYFTHDYSLILIGDCNQLPPIGLGSFFSELIQSDKIPVYRLTINKRIASSGISNILINANRLIDPRRDLKEPFVFRTSLGFELIPGDIKTCKIVLNKLQKKVKKEKITVLTPFNKDIPEINNYAQQIFSEDEGCEFMGITYRIGDRVMQTQNVYNEKIEVMNGEEGYIVELNENFLKVDFSSSASSASSASSSSASASSASSSSSSSALEDSKHKDSEHEHKDKIIEYIWKINEAKMNEDEQVGEKEFVVSDLKHSFCKSVHKSQGSEYDYVILYVPKYISSNDFININLLYTAITRTKKNIWLIGDLDTIRKGCSVKLTAQYQRLSEKLRN